MKDIGQGSASWTTLREAAPYLRLFRGKTFVVKLGGEVCTDGALLGNVVHQVDVLHQLGIRVVLVHGGGSETSALCAALGSTVRFAAGRRVTDDAALAAVVMTLNGTVNTRVVAACRAVGLRAVGLSGVDAGLLQARRRPPVEVAGEGVVDYGHVGDLVGADAAVLETLLAAGYLPVVSPLAADGTGKLLNVNADSAAAAVAVALQAEKLLLLTAARGVLRNVHDAHSLVSYIDLAGLRRLRDLGTLERGMLPKAAAIETAVRGGVPRVHVLSHAHPEGLLAEVFTNEGVGTLVVEELSRLQPAEQVAEPGPDQGAGPRDQEAAGVTA